MPIQKNRPAEIKPCEIICITEPCKPSNKISLSIPGFTMLKARNIPSVTNPICATEEYAINFFMSF